VSTIVSFRCSCSKNVLNIEYARKNVKIRVGF